MSSKSVVNLINGLFETDYPPDSTVEYNWTEFTDEQLKRILADTIITINGRYSYHMEAQVGKDDTIVFRVFEYSFGHADNKRSVEDGKYTLNFPRPAIIYLYYESEVPDEYVLTLSFEEGRSTYEYKVPVIKLPAISARELNDRKMVILIPFHLLKLRNWVKTYSSEEVMEKLKDLVEDDIIGSIEANREAGNITQEDAYKLRRYTQKLWEYLKAHTKELEGCEDMTDESFMTDIDILCEDYEKKIMQARKEGRVEGREAGIRTGEDFKLLSLVCRKLQKGKPVDVIADELEEELERIEHICQVAERFAPEYDVEKIYEELHSVSVV